MSYYVNVNRVYYFFIIIHDGIIFMIALYIDAITGQDQNTIHNYKCTASRPCCHSRIKSYKVSESNTIVNGPSLISATSISAPNTPVFTTGTSFLQASMMYS